MKLDLESTDAFQADKQDQIGCSSLSLSPKACIHSRSRLISIVWPCICNRPSILCTLNLLDCAEVFMISTAVPSMQNKGFDMHGLAATSHCALPYGLKMLEQ